MTARPAIYFRMPRVASDSIMQLVRRRCTVLPHSAPPEHVRHFLIQNETAFRFTFVRHPYSRFASAYRWSQRDLDPELFPFDAQECLMTKDCAIEQVIGRLHYLCCGGKAIHFNPQASYVFDGKKRLVDWVGKFETLEEDFDTIAEHLGLRRGLEFGANRKAPHGLVGIDLSTDARRALDVFYAEDFERFGYEPH